MQCVLLNYLPSVVTTTDAGAGIGYTYMRVRGSDGSRINVTLNGVPFNDSESQGTFFVNLPDFASSLESIQLQRGVGTSTSGAGAFGASLNLQTKAAQQNSYAEIANSIGSFGTRKHTLAFGTGLHNNFEMNARISKIKSDGFIDRASSDLFGSINLIAILLTSFSSLNNISIAPNPSNGLVTITKNNQTTISKINVFDINGKVVKIIDSELNLESIQIDLSKFSSGVYFVEISNDNDKIVRKIVKE